MDGVDPGGMSTLFWMPGLNDAEATASQTTKPTFRQRLDAVIERYGWIAIGTYLVIFLATWAGFALALVWGFNVESAAGSATIAGAAWIATKVTQPIRIVATLALTPFVAPVIWRIRPPQQGDG